MCRNKQNETRKNDRANEIHKNNCAKSSGNSKWTEKERWRDVCTCMLMTSSLSLMRSIERGSDRRTKSAKETFISQNASSVIRNMRCFSFYAYLLWRRLLNNFQPTYARFPCVLIETLAGEANEEKEKKTIGSKRQRMKFYENLNRLPHNYLNFVTYFKIHFPRTSFDRWDVNQIFIIRRFGTAATHLFSYRTITIDKTWRKLHIINLSGFYVHGAAITVVRYNTSEAQYCALCKLHIESTEKRTIRYAHMIQK